MNKEKISIVWFKKDLRVKDNLALLSGSKTNLPVLPLYIFEKDYWKQDFSSQRHWEFIHDCLIDINEDLKKIGQSLIIKIGEIWISVNSFWVLNLLNPDIEIKGFESLNNFNPAFSKKLIKRYPGIYGYLLFLVSRF